MLYLTYLSSIGLIISVLYYFAACVAGLRFARRSDDPSPKLPKLPPRVALLKPLRGLSEDLLENIISFLEIRYSRKQFVFGISDYNDRAAEVPLALKPRYQFADIAITIGGDKGANRKVGKLMRMVTKAPRAEVFVLSDADIRVEPDYLDRIVGELYADPDVGIVTCAYRSQPRTAELGARLEALYANTDFMPMTILASALEPLHYAFGATIAMKRQVLEEVGGFACVKDLLADDFCLGQEVARRGYRIKLSNVIVTIIPGEKTFSDFWHHQLRWARTYKAVRPISLATIFTHGPTWAILLMLSTMFNPLAIAAGAAAVLARCATAAVLIKSVARLRFAWSDIPLLLLKDLVNTSVWAASLAGNTVRWGDRRFKINAGHLHELAPAGQRRPAVVQTRPAETRSSAIRATGLTPGQQAARQLRDV